LLEYEDGTQKYRTTEKGLRLLKIYNQIEELIPSTINTSNKDIF
jgi:predicted transcriptional regulator